ncbi:DNRLRE domain-containing protein [Pseudoduganella lutea]|uniref:DNRLRE domain-containing protein n=1 Tax=Pseudoduganella lutea TaxID=321985 RepID=A0A4P6L3N6_9BURK|nr:DNRLRE domain-containing protein [Pseudoduganella lutea]QBE65458.1 DNRLRE domain-containing protein [Pseudoduganella lutea]
MRASPRHNRQSGALLLIVALLLATMAALAFGVNRAASMDAIAVQGDYESRAAGYLAEAAVAAARWGNQAAGCMSEDVPLTAFGLGTIRATVAKASSKRLNIVATGTIGGDTIRTIERKEVDIVDFTKTETRDLTAAALDITIDASRLMADGANDTLSLVSDRAYALLYWPISEISADMRVVAATLTLTQNGSSAVTRPVGVHRMTTRWDSNATWRIARPGVGWTGGDFGDIAAAATTVAGASRYSWDVTSLVDGWVAGRLANYGMLLRLANPGQSANFYSFDAGAAQRPVLRVVTAKAC